MQAHTHTHLHPGWPKHRGWRVTTQLEIMDHPPSDTVFIQEITPVDLTEKDLYDVFNQYGHVQSVKFGPNDTTGQLDALVRFRDMNEAQWAVDNINGDIPSGTHGPVRVRFARASDQPGIDTVFIGDLPTTLSETDIATIFSMYGQVRWVKVLPHSVHAGMCAALVRFGAVSNARWIVDHVNGCAIQGVNTAVQARFARPSRTYHAP